MPLTKLQFRPGINREITSYSNEGGWDDCDKVRFRFGFPEKIGGWEKRSSNSFLGSCRSLIPWVTLNNTHLIGVGTSTKYYIDQGGGFNDITPIRTSNLLNRNTTFNVLGTSCTGSVGEVTKNENQVYPDGVSGTGDVGTAYVSTGGDVVVVVGTDAEELPYAEGFVGEVTLGGDVYASVSVSVTGISASTSVDSVASSQETVTFTDDISLSATNGSSTITATVNAAHGALPGAFFTMRGAVGLGGNITAAVLNQEYPIDSVPTSTTFTFAARAAGTSIQSITVDGQLDPTLVSASASDTGDGGDAIEVDYQINVGLDTAVGGSGWGAGSWSRSGWGSSSNAPIITNQLRLWSNDNFGEDLLINARDGGIYYWDSFVSSGQGGPSFDQRAVAISELSGASGAPTVAKQVLVSDRDRHVIAFGCDPVDNIGTQDPMLIRFSDQESVADWTPTATNTAGDLRLGSGSEIIRAIETRQQILVFTDTTLYSMQYLGAPYTFGVGAISENISIFGPNAVVAIDDSVFWMGNSEFYSYTGQVEILPCTVRSFVYDDLNVSQGLKVCAALNSKNSEVWWFYPSANSEINDRYVVYNYAENLWYYGTMERTAWIDHGVFDNPIAASPDHYLYTQEFGLDDGSTYPPSPVNAYISSSPIDMGEGQQFTFIRRLLPDVSFRNSVDTAPSVDITTRVRNSTNSTFLATTTSPIGTATEQVHLRLRGRQFSVRVASDELGVTWRLGSLRYDVQPDGSR